MFGWLTGGGDPNSDSSAQGAKPGFHPVELPASPVSSAPLGEPPAPSQSSSSRAVDVPDAGAQNASTAGNLFGGMSVTGATSRRRRGPHTRADVSDVASQGTAASVPATTATDQTEAQQKPFFAKVSLALDLDEVPSAGHGDINSSRFRQRLEVFFREYCPNKLPLVDQLVEEFHDDEEALMKRLVAKHGPEPPALQEADFAGGSHTTTSQDTPAPHATSAPRPAPSVSSASAFAFVVPRAGPSPGVAVTAEEAKTRSAYRSTSHTTGVVSRPPAPSSSEESLTDSQTLRAPSSPTQPKAAETESLPASDSEHNVSTTVPSPEQCAEALLSAQSDVARRLTDVIAWLDTTKTAAALHDAKEKEVSTCVEKEAYDEADAAHHQAEEALAAVTEALAKLGAVVADGLGAEKATVAAGVAQCVESLQRCEERLLAVQGEKIEALEAAIAAGDADIDNKVEAHALAMQEAHSALEESTVSKSRMKQEATRLKESFKAAAASVTANVEGLNSECDALQLEIRALEDQLDDLRGQYDEKNQRLESATREYEALEDDYEEKARELMAALDQERERQASAVEAQQQLAEASAALDAERAAWEARKADLLSSIATCKAGAGQAKERRTYLVETHGPLLESFLTVTATSLESRCEGHGILYHVPLVLLGEATCQSVLGRASPLSRQLALQRDQLAATEALSMTRQLVASLTARVKELRTRVPVLQAEKDAAVSCKAFREAKEKTDEIHRVQSTITASEEELADLASRQSKEEKRLAHIASALDQEKVLSRGRAMGFLSTYQQNLRKMSEQVNKLRKVGDASDTHSGLTSPELVDAAAQLVQMLSEEAKAAEDVLKKSPRPTNDS